MINILIIDDHAIIRSGLRLLIDAQPDMQVVGQAGDLCGGLAEAQRTAPSVVVLDLSMPDAPGLSGVERVVSSVPSARVLVLTMHDDPAYARGAVARGATGYVVKSAADSDLISAIRAVNEGRMFVDTRNGGTHNAATRGDLPGGRVAVIQGLSDREREVLANVAAGYTSQQIANQLGLSVKTVESYRSRAMHKLSIKSRAELVSVAVACGLLADRPPAG